ncbi:unnamed protein product, partial [Mesorhabditis spiculigera]
MRYFFGINYLPNCLVMAALDHLPTRDLETLHRVNWDFRACITRRGVFPRRVESISITARIRKPEHAKEVGEQEHKIWLHETQIVIRDFGQGTLTFNSHSFYRLNRFPFSSLIDLIKSSVSITCRELDVELIATYDGTVVTDKQCPGIFDTVTFQLAFCPRRRASEGLMHSVTSNYEFPAHVKAVTEFLSDLKTRVRRIHKGAMELLDETEADAQTLLKWIEKHAMPSHPCPHCSFVFDRPYNLKRHCDRLHGGSPIPIIPRKKGDSVKCHICQARMRDEEALEDHVSAYHSFPVPEIEPPAPGFYCTECVVPAKNYEDFVMHFAGSHEDSDTHFEINELKVARDQLSDWVKEFEERHNARFAVRTSNDKHRYLKCAQSTDKDGAITCPSFIRINFLDAQSAEIIFADKHSHAPDIPKLTLRNSLVEDRIVALLQQGLLPRQMAIAASSHQEFDDPIPEIPVQNENMPPESQKKEALQKFRTTLNALWYAAADCDVELLENWQEDIEEKLRTITKEKRKPVIAPRQQNDVPIREASANYRMQSKAAKRKLEP